MQIWQSSLKNQTPHHHHPKQNQTPSLRRPPLHHHPPPPTTTKSNTTTTNPFHFWFYFTLVVSLIVLFFISISSLYPQDPKTWFLNLPPVLRLHYSKGRTIKVQTAPNYPQVEVFSIQEGPTNSDSHVLFVHGLGCSSFAFHSILKSLGHKNVHAVAIDLPGSGFSDKSVVVVEENVGGNGGFGGLWKVYSDIKEKGLFWGFDQLIEQGYVNHEENEIRVLKKESVKAIELGGEEMGRVLGQVVDSMGLAPVDLVLHDSALGLSANWISENQGLVRSVVVLDAVPSGTALPLWALEMPVLRDVTLGFRFVFKKVLAKCCGELFGGPEAEAHRILLKGRDGRRAVAGMGKKLNFSFDLAEWSGLDGVKGLPMRVIWSGGFSEEWSDRGRQVADVLPQVTLVTHSGGRWPQEHNAEEVAESIYDFVSSLPKSTKTTVEEQIPEHIQKMIDEAKSGDHHHHHGHGGHDQHEHSHGHGHAHAGYMDAYGLGQGWAM
ncbi:Protein AUXIN RESPONSE 4 [Abeliophyllum distichum]|uniref:Protein AUXIN RESPONSE 4 n=1 Tax=Abeliophyllum distichum TaxID=126358 RepID=A0ABD1RQ43_9LAMI